MQEGESTITLGQVELVSRREVGYCRKLRGKERGGEGRAAYVGGTASEGERMELDENR